MLLQDSVFLTVLVILELTIILQTIPDFPGTLQDFKDLVLRFVTSIKYIFIYYPSLFFRASSLNGDRIDPFMAFLDGLVGGKERIDNL